MKTTNLSTIFTSIALALFMLALPLSVKGQTVTPTLGGNKTARLTTVNTNCQNAVTQRLTALSAVQTRIPTLKRLSSTLQQQYVGEVVTNISGMQSVQTACTNDFNSSNLTSLTSDYKSVFTSYRIFAVMLPQLRLLIASDTMGFTENNLSALYTKLQTRVQQAGNPSTLTTPLADMNAKITDAESQYTTVESQVTSLTPSSYNTNPSGTTSTFQTARSEIKTGASDLQAAFSDAKQIVQLLKSSSATPSVSPVPTE